MTNEQVKKIVIGNGLFDEKENTRIYYKFFRDWAENNSYVYKKFDISFDKKILDIGCSYGQNLIHFNKESVGIEAQHRTAEFSRALGLTVIEANIEDGILLDKKFDIIWCSDFLVHLISPYKFLYDYRKFLNDNGRLLIQIPLMSALNKHKSPCHLYAFDKKSLVYLMETAGYKIIKTSGCIRQLPGLVNKLLEPFLQIYGSNIWVLAEKSETEINFTKSFLPKWFKE